MQTQQPFVSVRVHDPYHQCSSSGSASAAGALHSDGIHHCGQPGRGPVHHHEHRSHQSHHAHGAHADSNDRYGENPYVSWHGHHGHGGAYSSAPPPPPRSATAGGADEAPPPYEFAAASMQPYRSRGVAYSSAPPIHEYYPCNDAYGGDYPAEAYASPAYDYDYSAGMDSHDAGYQTASATASPPPETGSGSSGGGLAPPKPAGEATPQQAPQAVPREEHGAFQQLPYADAHHHEGGSGSYDAERPKSYASIAVAQRIERDSRNTSPQPQQQAQGQNQVPRSKTGRVVRHEIPAPRSQQPAGAAAVQPHATPPPAPEPPTMAAALRAAAVAAATVTVAEKEKAAPVPTRVKHHVPLPRSRSDEGMHIPSPLSSSDHGSGSESGASPPGERNAEPDTQEPVPEPPVAVEPEEEEKPKKKPAPAKKAAKEPQSAQWKTVSKGKKPKSTPAPSAAPAATATAFAGELSDSPSSDSLDLMMDSAEDVPAPEPQPLDAKPKATAAPSKKASKNNAKKGGGGKKNKESEEDFELLLQQLKTVQKSEAPSQHKQAHQRVEIISGEKRLKNAARRVEDLLNKAKKLSYMNTKRASLLQEAHELAAQCNSPYLLAHVLIELSELHTEISDSEKAHSIACDAKKMATVCKDDALLLRANYLMGKNLGGMVLPEEAVAPLEAALKLAESLQDTRYIASVKTQLASVAELRSEFVLAFELYQEAIELAKSINDKPLEAEIKAALGLAYEAVGDVDSAIATLEPIMQQALASKDTTTINRTLTNLAHVYNTVNRSDEAIALCLQQVQVAHKNGDVHLVAHSLCTLGTIYRMLERYDESISVLIRQLEIEKDLDVPVRIAECEESIALTYRMMGKLSVARHHVNNLMRMGQVSKDDIIEAKALVTLAELLQCEGKAREASELCLQALYMTQGVSDAERQRYFIKIGLYDIEWRAFDVLEVSLRETERMMDAVWSADRKHLSVLPRLMGKPFAKPLTPRKCFDANYFPHADSLHEALRTSGVEVAVMFSLRWSEYKDALNCTAFVMHQEAKMVGSRAVPLTQQLLATLCAQDSNFRQLLVDKEIEMPLLSHTLNAKAEEGRWKPESKPVTEFEDHLAIMYEALVKPVEWGLPKTAKNSVAFICDGFLSNVPFHALRGEDGKRLIQRFPIVVASSVEQFVLAHKIQSAHQAAAIDVCTQFQRIVHNGDAPQWLKDMPHTSELDCSKVRPNRAAAEFKQFMEAESRLTFVHVPAVQTLKDDFIGQYTLGTGPTTMPVHCETICHSWNTQKTSLIVNLGFGAFTSRVAHETTVSLTKAWRASGTRRCLNMLWKMPEQPSESDLRVLRFLSECKLSLKHKEGTFFTWAHAVQAAMIDAIERGDDTQSWARFQLYGEP